MRRWRWLTVLLLVLLAPPARAQQTVRLSPITCTDGSFATITAISETFSGAGSRRVVTATAGKQTILHSFLLRSDTANVSIKFTTGTGATCTTGLADLTGLLLTYSAAAQTVDSSALNPPWAAPASVDVCLYSSLAATLSGELATCKQ